MRRTVAAAGLGPLLAALLSAQAHGGNVPSVELLAVRQEIGVQLDALKSQLSAMLFEVDCTGDALEDLLQELDGRERARELKLTIASLVVGAAAGVAAGAWDVVDRESKGPPIVSVVGAAATGALGIAAFIPRAPSVRLAHARNLLAPIARGDDPEHVYPTFVFRLLSLAPDAAGVSPRSELLARWRALLGERVSPAGRAGAEALLFGEGGLYTTELLAVRQTLLDQLESQVAALHRDLELLERYVANVSRSTAPDARAPYYPR